MIDLEELWNKLFAFLNSPLYFTASSLALKLLGKILTQLPLNQQYLHPWTQKLIQLSQPEQVTPIFISKINHLI